MMRAKKSLGQHFLCDPEIVSHIIEALAPRPGETILEIGPGQGVLTFPLVASGADIVAVELDRRLAPELAQALASYPNFRVIEADILSINPETIGLQRFSLIGNLPYNITTPVMEWLLRNHEAIDRAVLMMQKEVAQRMASPSGRKTRSSISVITSLYYDSDLTKSVPPTAFEPPPHVDSAVVRFVHHNRKYDIGDPLRFERFVRSCFVGKRKNLLNNLIAAYSIPREEASRLIIEICGSDRLRAEQLELADFVTLAKAVIARLGKSDERLPSHHREP